MRRFNHAAVVADRTEGMRILRQKAEALWHALRFVANDQVDTHGFCTGVQDLEGLRMTVLGSKEDIGLGA